jgi:hypothetical protein
VGVYWPTSEIGCFGPFKSIGLQIPEDLRAIPGVFGYFTKDEEGFWEELTDEVKAQDEVLVVKLVPRPNEGGTFRLNSYEPLSGPIRP